ncbi:MAG: hypothetical protein ABIF92_00900, partial [archaeon]
PAGLSTVNVFIENVNAKEYATITLNVADNLEAGADGGAGAGLTGYLLTTTGGIAAVIIALLLLAAIIGYYYYSKQDEDVIEGIDENRDDDPVGLGESNSGPGNSPSGSSGLFENLKKAFIGSRVNKTAPVANAMPMSGAYIGSEKTMKRKQDGINLDRLETVITKPVEPVASGKTGQMLNPWGAKDAEQVLADLEGIKREFHSTYENARTLKQKLHGISTGLGQKSEKIQTQLEPKVAETGPRPTASNGYIKSVIESI